MGTFPSTNFPTITLKETGVTVFNGADDFKKLTPFLIEIHDDKENTLLVKAFELIRKSDSPFGLNLLWLPDYGRVGLHDDTELILFRTLETDKIITLLEQFEYKPLDMLDSDHYENFFDAFEKSEWKERIKGELTDLEDYENLRIIEGADRFSAWVFKNWRSKYSRIFPLIETLCFLVSLGFIYLTYKSRLSLELIIPFCIITLIYFLLSLTKDIYNSRSRITLETALMFPLKEKRWFFLLILILGMYLYKHPII